MEGTAKNARQSAAEAYAARYAECAQLLRRIGDQLDQHQKLQAAKPRDWGFAGDLGRVSEELAYVLASLGDPSAVERKGLAY